MLRSAALVTLLAAPLLFGQTDAVTQRLRTDYQKKTFLLRGFYQDTLLRFDSSGNIKHHAEAGSWTTAYILVDIIERNSARLEIRGTRSVQVFHRRKHRFREHRTQLPVVIEVDLDPASPLAEAAVRRSLDSIFIDTHQPLAPLVPDAWRPLFDRMNPQGVVDRPEQLAKKQPCGPSPTPDEPCSVGNGVTAPQPIVTQSPSFPEIARVAQVDGTTELRLIVDSSGHPQRIHISSPLGCGLDDQAVETVRLWTFHPALRDGQPVPVQITAKVNFSLSRKAPLPSNRPPSVSW